MIRNTVDLAIRNPKQAAFAAELLGAAISPDANDDGLKRRLGILAGTNVEARNLLEMFRKMAERGGDDPYSYLYTPLNDQDSGQETSESGEPEKPTAGAATLPEESAADKGLSLTDKVVLGALGIMKGQTELETPKAALHGGIKGVNSVIDLAYDGADYLKENGWLDGETTVDRLKLPNLPDPASPAGKMVSSISQFLVGFKGIDKAAKGIKAVSYGANAAKNAVQAFVTDFAFFDGQEERLSNMIQRNPTLANPINEYLAAAPSDGKAEGRLKNALEGLGLGAAAEALVYGVRLTKFGRTAKEMQNANAHPDETVSDLAGRQAAMKDREPAVTLTGKEFTATEPKALRQEVADWYKTNLAGTSGNHHSLGEFRFGGDAGKPISKSADTRKLQIFPELKKVIETSEHVASSPSIKAKDITRPTEYHYARNTVKVGDELIDVGLVLRKDNNGQLYYDHMIHDMQALKDAPWASPASVNPLSPTGTKGPEGTRGSHPALHGALEKNIGGGEGQVNLFILGTRSLRGLNTTNKK